MKYEFRGKSLLTGKWVYGSLLVKGYHAWIIDDSVKTKQVQCDIKITTKPIPVDMKTIGQFTGLTDKNGKKIYEKDIVKCMELRDEKIIEYVSPVFWVNCCFLVHESETCDCELGLFEDRPNKQPLTEIEVIGNTVDNTKMLEVNKS